MSERLLSPPVYFAVLVILLVLTIATVGLSFVPSSGAMHLVSGQAIALVKASLVVLFFMHALRSAVQTRVVIIVTLFWLVVVFASLIFIHHFSKNGQITHNGPI